MTTLPTQNRTAMRSSTTLFGHPVGLFLLFMVEMWERFSYYGMRALLVLYLTTPETGMRKLPPGFAAGFNPGPGWNDKDASTLYGWYCGLAYLTPVLGGLVADRLIGTHRSMLVGGLIIMLGHIALAVSGIEGLNNSGLGISVFVFGLALIVVGTGHFKPSVSVMVGELYVNNNAKRDSAFSIFYMGINLGALLGALGCGYLGERVGWHWGFGAAAVGMFFGLMMYTFGKPLYLKNIGELASNSDSNPGVRQPVAGAFAGLFLIGGVILSALFAAAYRYGLLTDFSKLLNQTVIVTLAILIFGLATWFVAIQRPGDRGPTATIFIFMLFNTFFWFAFEQAGSSINLFTDRYTNRNITLPSVGMWQVPASFFQSVNPAMIILLATPMALLWGFLGKRKLNPSQPIKIALALILVGLGFGLLVIGAGEVRAAGEDVQVKAGLLMLIGAYFLHTVGELCLSPTGLSYVTRAAPVRFVSLLMGIWFVSSFLANLSAGLTAGQIEKLEKGEMALPWKLAPESGIVQADFFMLFVVTSVGAGVVILGLTPLLKSMMRPEQR